MAISKIPGAGVSADTLEAGDIAANAIGASELANNAVDTAAIADDAVTNAKIGADAVGTTELANDVAISTSGAITTTGGMTVDGATVFNEASADVDFRVEGNGDANLIFADASTDRVGIGCADPQDNLEVRSSAGAHFRVDGDSATSVGVKVRNNYDAGSGAVQSEWTLAAGGGTSEFGVYNGSFVIRDTINNDTGLEIQRGSGQGAPTLTLLGDESGLVNDVQLRNYYATIHSWYENIGAIASGATWNGPNMGCNVAHIFTYWNTDGNAYGHGAVTIRAGGYNGTLATLITFDSHYGNTSAPSVVWNRYSGCSWRIQLTNNDSSTTNWQAKLFCLNG